MKRVELTVYDVTVRRGKLHWKKIKTYSMSRLEYERKRELSRSYIVRSGEMVTTGQLRNAAWLLRERKGMVTREDGDAD